MCKNIKIIQIKIENKLCILLYCMLLNRDTINKYSPRIQIHIKMEGIERALKLIEVQQ